MDKDLFLSCGLSDKESLVYSYLLENGEVSAGEIIKKTRLKRGITYKILYSLEEKNLVDKKRKQKRLFFSPSHPYRLLELMQGRVSLAIQQQHKLESVLPYLVESFRVMQNTPGVRVFQGIEGIKKVYEDTLKEGKNISAILQTAEVDAGLYRWLTQTYVQKRVKSGIFARVIVAHDEKSKAYQSRDEKENRESRLVPANKFPVGIEVDIYGDKIAFMAFKKGEDQIGIIIENPLIALTMRSLFDLAWEQAQKLDKKL